MKAQTIAKKRDTTMTESDMALEIAKHILYLEEENQTLKDTIERQPNARKGVEFQHKLLELKNRIQTDQKFLQRTADIERVFESQDHPKTLIRALHDQILRRMKVPMD
jgi:hypothetical protein